jgi:putative tryptophan/tyrosine transport system substrate-binding protein
VRRREFIAGLGSTAAWPVVARAQQPAMPVIGFLSGTSPDDRVVAFREGLKETGFIEGQNAAIEYRWAHGQTDRLQPLVADLVSRQVTVIAVVGSAIAALAAKGATATIPIVFSVGVDPVKSGLVVSLNRPGGNLTGVSFLANMMASKRFELLHDMVPAAALIGFLVNPTNANAEAETKEIQAAADVLGHHLVVLAARTEGDISAAFAALSNQQARGIIIQGDPFFASRRQLLAILAARHALPGVCSQREDAAVGCLMSYGTSFANANHQVGIYVGKILKGATPADLPVMQSSKFQLVINLNTAKALSLKIPPTLLALTDEVIE